MFVELLLAFQTVVATGPAAPPRERAKDPPPPRSIPAPTARGATAARAEVPPVLDGLDTDEVWRSAPAITQFRQFDPVEDGDPRYRTEARVAYDAKYLYVFVRAYDPAPDSVMAFLSRRDARTQSDYIHLMVDSYNDKRTGFRFTVNPIGVKRDVYISNDGNEDLSWDGVWDAVTKVDEQGWTAEYRIPFSQLRFPEAEAHTFGFAIWRDIARHNERISWPLYRRTQMGFVSQFGEVDGFRGIASPRRLEVLPYSVTSDAPRPTATGFGRQQTLTLGADVKYGITSNLTLDATVNPDFGQVEADPAVLNLGAFEQFFEERRPFFLEGAGIFNFASNLFYSRRVGRAPQLGGTYYRDDNPLNTTILGAAKVTGRTAGGLNVGFVNAVADRELGDAGRTIEPQTNYAVLRLSQDLRNGNSGVGLMATATNRSLDDDTRRFLREGAYALGVDARHRFGPNNNFQVSGSAVGSLVTGSQEALWRTQRSAVHQFQRPDSRYEVDSSLTQMAGSRFNVSLGKNGGGITRFNTGVTRISAGYEVNDAGFQTRADITQNGNWFGLQFMQPTKLYRRLFVNFNQWNDFTTDGLHLNTGGNININGELPNQWWFWTGFNVNGIGEVYDDRVMRGGAALRRNQRVNTWFGFETDRRKSVAYVTELWAVFKDVSGSYNWGVDPMLHFRAGGRVQGSVALNYSESVNDQQWYNNFNTPGGVAYTFARLEQKTAGVTTRLDYTMTPALSLQLYAQPFVTAGDYSDLREVVAPRADRYEDRFQPYTAAEPDDFNFKQFRSNTVLRWEYRPGSVLFFVWQQGRQDFRNPGSFDFGRDYGDLFRTRSDNTFLIKASYWFSL
ncbi:MAG: carbohydrate binding family 9 domain-containing protein [Gemmatimonadaceae bacterium]|nr:carbohydrate binding family 9 domain-containing protein [Gemmatimonadaceae bacterium]MCW5826574.1 carbohydrate binding family 9 domain-containing protein [Gemmatimonadaceae bacterium]